jgi:DNA polymerase, archaea type
MEMAGAFSRSGRFRTLAARSYWSYGQACHRDGAILPDGRALIDTLRSFVYREGGLKGVILASRLSGLPPNLSSRFTPGTIVSSYEVYEALTRGIAVPFRKRDAECMRKLPELRSRDKGGLILQPDPGLEERVFQIDFTSMYPTIIVNYNLSPESLDRRVDGFLAQVIRPLLNLRLIAKGLKKSNREYAGLDSVLKWMLVTCFGYTGYRNARFGSIEVHEKITGISREMLMQAKEISESMGFLVLHGIVDCLFVKGEGIEELESRIESQTGIGAEVESYNWIVFLPQKGGRGAYNRYFGRLVDGKMKVKGIAARRSDTPEYVRRMQQEVLDILAKAGCSEEISALEERAAMARQRYLDGLNRANPKEMAIKRRLSQLSHKKACPEASAVKAAAMSGEALAPGIEVEYVIVDARGWSVCQSDQAEEFDATYYQKLLDKAWEDMEFAFRCARLQPHVHDCRQF